MPDPAHCPTCGSPLDETGLCAMCTDPGSGQSSPLSDVDDPTLVPGRSRDFDEGEQPKLSQFGDYELLEEIARGGMGVVYKARHTKLNRLAAIKMILGGRFSSDDELQRFHIEAEAAARLDHSGIVPVYEIGDHDGQAFFAMKYIDGGALSDRMAELHADPRSAVRMLATVAEAVHHAHQRGILHRDLKPANILIDENGHPLVTDLGLAKSTADDSQLTKTGAVIGTPSYMSPEQAAGQTTVTTATDIYALGAILYEILTGQPPHKGATAFETVLSVRNDSPPSPRKLNPAIDAELELICLKCIERNPDDRYASAAALAADLNHWLAGDAISVAPPSFAAVASRWIRQNKKVVYSGLALLVGMAFSVPLFASFFSNDIFDVHRHFPDAERPWFFALGSLPHWADDLSSLVFIVVWPTIGLWNAMVMRPSSLGRAALAGIVTATVCSILVAGLFGWAVVMIVAGDYASDHLVTLGQAVWTPDGTTPEAADKAALELFAGLEAVPQGQRARVLADRIFYEQIARAPWAFVIIGIACVILALPIIYGTMIASILLDRKLTLWLLCLRYVLAWISTTCLAVLIIGYAIGLISGDLSFRFAPVHILVTSLSLATLFLTVRRWKPTPTQPSQLSGSERPTPTPVAG